MSKLPACVGVDFGTHSVKAVELANADSDNPRLVNLGAQITPKGAINSEDKADQKALADVLKKLYDSSSIKNKNIVMALPEFSVFTRFLEFPGVKMNELKDAVYFEAKQYIPMPLSEVQLSFMPIGFNEERNAPRVLVVAAPRKIVDVYINIAQLAGLDLLAIETEALAMGRAMYKATKKGNLVMLDFGANSTDMCIMSDSYIVFSQSIAIGSDSLTQAIVNKFNFDVQRAEQFKRSYGLIPTVLEGKIYEVLSPIMESILIEVRRGIEFYKTRTLSPAPTEYILSGDGALLPGLKEYLAKDGGVTVSLANPWACISVDSKFADIVAKSSASYSVAIGLAEKDDK